MNQRSPRQAAHTLRRVWSRRVPDYGSPKLVSSGDKIVLGTGQGWFTDLSGSLVVLDANSGDILRLDHNYWQVNSVAVSADGRWLATSERPQFSSGSAHPGDVDRIRILDLNSGGERCRHQNNLPSGAGSLAFSPDGRSVAAVGDATPLVFDAASGTERWRIPGWASWSVAWSPDSASVAVGLETGVSVLESRFGTQRLLAPSPSPVAAVDYSPDGQRLVAGCMDGTVRVFAADSGAQSWFRQVSESAVTSVVVSADGRWVAGTSRGMVLTQYDLASGTPRYPPVHYDLPNAGGQVLFSPTLRHVLVTGTGAATAVIEARTGRLVDSFSGPACLIPPDGNAIATYWDFEVERYDLGVAVSEHSVGTSLTALAMSPTGTPLIAVADASAAVTVADAASGVRLARKPIPGTIASLTFADGGQAVVAGGSDGVRLFSVVGSRFWKIDTIGAVNALAAVGAAGAWIATAAGRTVQLLSSIDGQGRWPSPTTHPHTVTRIAASADGTRIATGCLDRTTRLLDALTGTVAASIEGDGRVTALSFAPDRAVLAAANEDGTVLLLDPATGSELSRITRLFACSRVAFSADGGLLATAWDDNTVLVFDVTSSSSPQEVHPFSFSAPVSGLAFNPAEPTLAIAVEGAPVVIYDPGDGTELVRVLQPAAARQIAFSGDGAWLATAGDDHVVRVWTSGLPPGD